MAPAVIEVTYDLHPPEGTPLSGLEPTKTHQFALSSSTTNAKDYYGALRAAVLDAKTTLGEELTAWRDAVGTREQGKESKKQTQGEEEEDEGEDVDEE
ncbi:hypothetical protein IEO21_01221 [Rhodonia placenta]|uniref:EKC/KEOPS complex subunit GON7 n=2 Tax=Rhodonia placenta TaxID=104341 RepID=A0A1X6NDS6_9APHY|nr:hypothetical protein POSPLADRAFT_1127461 [Postia placenta MAD-698-R-SB12]KAF9820778.1 hypothetical protein IEO21_01221 [Postia placenta]OSX66789.1 hypothetical protein POSPLADRAFT_1127461 [Postia placenta MAD-698-R-SB12]